MAASPGAWCCCSAACSSPFAGGRRTVASWLRAGELGQDYKRFYYLLGSVGRKVEWIALCLLRLVTSRVHAGDILLFAIDDTPTQRAGPQVEGAGIHHNTPRRDPPSRSSSTAMSGSPSPGSCSTPAGV
ncbi:MAG: transposase [Gemmataceae bacterium]